MRWTLCLLAVVFGTTSAWAGRAPAGQPPAPMPQAVGPNAGNFVQAAGPGVAIHCGQLELVLDGNRGFSTALASNLAGALRTLLTSTTVVLWIGGQEQAFSTVGQLSNLVLAEEGPQRVVLRAPFGLTDPKGRPLANAQYDLTCYPEGEVYVTLRVLPLQAQDFDVAVALGFARDAGLRFERSPDLPLLLATSDAGPALGLYWHNGEPPAVDTVGGEVRGTFPCLLETSGASPLYSRTFVLSVARSADELRRRCRAHVQPLRPVRIEFCRALVEQTPETRAAAGESAGWCYSYREGTYNFLADGPQSLVEFYNSYDDARRVRLRFVTRAYPALAITREGAIRCDAVQNVSTTPEIRPGLEGHVAAALAAFDVGGRECLPVSATRGDVLSLQWAQASLAKDQVTRVYRLVTSDPPRTLAELRISDGGPAAGVQLTRVASPQATTAPAVAALAVMPAAGPWGRFSHLSELAVVRNLPDRVVLRVAAPNDARTASCRTDLVFRRTAGVLSLHGYHTLEASEGLRAATLELPRFEVFRGAPPNVLPQRFFFADERRQIHLCQPSPRRRFGYDIGSLNRTAHEKFGLCGFMGGSPGGLVFLSRVLDGAGRLAAADTSPAIAVRLELPAPAARGQRYQSFWKMLIPGTGQTNLRLLQLALGSIKGNPVDIEWAGDHFAVSDGAIAHRVFEVSPSGNPASEDGWCYLLDGGGELALVGAGADPLRWPWLFRLRAMGYDPAGVRQILLTHAGAGQTGGARALRQLTGAALRLHSTGAEALLVGGPDRDQRLDRGDEDGRPPFEAVSVDHPLGESEVLKVGDLSLRYLHTPGPSGDSGTYLADVGGLKVGFVGELLSAGDNGPRPAGCADAHPHGNLGQWYDSLRLLRSQRLDLAAGSRLAPVAGTEEVNAVCARAMDRLNAVFDTKEVDYLVPRTMVAGIDRSLRTSQTITRGELWGVKELDRSPFVRKAPLLIGGAVWRVGGGFVGENEDGNVYLVDGGSELALIGAGSGLHTRAIIQRILSLGKNPLDIKYILLPSNHWYEARGAATLRAATEARVCAHRYEAGAMWRGDTIRTGLRIGDFLFAGFPSLRIDRTLEWGEILRVGSREIIVLDAPGFHRGSTAFLIELGGQRYLATGEAALGDLPTPEGGTVTGATGWVDPHWGGCLATWRVSLERLLALHADVLLPGQGPVDEDDPDARLSECLKRLDGVARLPGAAALFPPRLLESPVPPPRPDLSTLFKPR